MNHLAILRPFLADCVFFLVIARSALAQEEAEEFSGEFSDPINIHLDNDRDGCPC